MARSLNDLWYKFLGDLGYSGSFNDRFYAYLLDQTKPPVWLLSGGSWNDEGRWFDNSVWEDM